LKKLIKPARIVALMLFMFVILAIYVVELYDLQVIHGERWSNYAENHRLVTTRIEATRGRLMDRNEMVLISNRSVNNIMLDWMALYHGFAGSTNDVLLDLVALSRSMGYTHTDTLPISDPPFAYTPMTEAQAHNLNRFIRQYERRIRNMIRDMSVLEPEEEEADPATPTPVPEALSIENVTAVQLMAFMSNLYRISAEYTAEETRIIAGIRYEVDLRFIIGMDEYIFVEDAGVELISTILERRFPGIRVQESSLRRYNTTVAAHILGRVGPITAEEVDLFPDHPLDAHVGKEGLERDFEHFLHGVNGQVRQTLTAGGTPIDERIIRAPEPGANVITTLDSGLQTVAEAALRSTVRQINTARGDHEDQALGGAVVAIDPRNGEVLAMASIPTFPIDRYSELFNQLAADESHPLLNRATGGAYSPGSAFKMVTAMAALYQGIITEHTAIFCGGHFILEADPDFRPGCMGRHGYISLRDAIAFSCNVYFFQLAEWMRLDPMAEFAEHFGLGTLTGIGFGEVPGQRSTWDTFLARNQLFGIDTVFLGEMIFTGVGQGVSLFTPLQMANYAATIANGGILYRPTLLREVRSHDGREVLYRPEPEIMGDMRTLPGMQNIFFTALQEGMVGTVTHGTARSQMLGFSVPTAGKTGTVELGEGRISDGVFVAYAPVDDPQIAIAVVIEKGGAGSAVIPVARAMFEHFFQSDQINQSLVFENVMLR